MSEPAILSRIDPEAAILLREIADHPNSILLKPRPLALSPHAGTLTPATPGLLAAERQFLRVHRFELGTLLHELAARRILDLLAEQARVRCHWRTTRSGLPRSTESLADELERQRQQPRIQGVGFAEATRCLDGQGRSIHAILNLASRLRPSSVSILNASVYWLHSNRLPFALAQLQTIRPEQLPYAHAEMYAHNSGLVLLGLHRFEEGLQVLHGLAMRSDDFCRSFSALVASILVGDTPKRLLHSKRLSEQPSEDQGAFLATTYAHLFAKPGLEQSIRESL